MNTGEVVDRLYGELDITKKDTKGYLKAMFEIWVEQLESERSFTIPGLGTFDTHTRESHVSYNPYYQSYMQIPPKRVANFKASQDLKSLIEGESADEG